MALVDRGPAGVTDLVFDAATAASAGADGIDLHLPDPQRALGSGLALADELAATSGLAVFLRSVVPIAPGGHRRIVALSDAASARSNDVIDLEVDRLGARPDHADVARRLSPSTIEAVAGSTPVLVSTAGFSRLSEGELMALATIAAVREVAAVTSHEVKIVRRVVDTVAAVLAAGVSS